jgi:hypothetical protein|tara:strand:+ start:1237 stop:1458 length:222 start_codon:yes stop_codon:yes gene_type:complete
MTRQEQVKRAERAIRINRTIQSRIEDLQILKGGILMSNKTFRTMLKEHPQLEIEFDILMKRKESIKRFIFNNA